MNKFESNLIDEEKKMIGFLADKLWDIMHIPELRCNFTDKEIETVEAIERHFSSDYGMRELNEGYEGWWNKT